MQAATVKAFRIPVNSHQ